MSVEQYSLVANDWLNLEFIINDLTQRVVGQEVHPTSEPTFGAGTITNNLAVGGNLAVTGDFEVDGSLTLTGLTASRIVATNASKVLVSLASPLIITEGGTGAATLTDHGILLGSGTGAVTPLGAAANGYIPIGSTGADPVLALIAGTTNQITSTPGAGSITLSLPNPIAIPGKLTAGSFGSPLDVTDTRQYGVELHYSGNNYDVTGVRSRAHLVTTDTTATALGGLFQAANNDNVDAGVLMGFMAEAIGKSTANASTIATMRGGLIGTEWGAFDTITNLKTLHIRGHSRNAAGAGSFGTGYGIYIENEAVGGNGQAYDAGIYFKGTNLSAGNKAFTYGIDFSGADYGSACINVATAPIGMDFSSGTFATAVQKWPTGIIQSTGDVAFQPTSDGTTRYQWLDADGGVPILNIDTTNERIGINTVDPQFQFHITNINSGNDDTTHTIIYCEAETDGDMVDGYGARLRFVIKDAISSRNQIANIGGVRDGADNIGALIFQAGVSGAEEFMRLHGTGELQLVGPTPYYTLRNNTEEDIDGGGENRLIFTREDGSGTETTAFQFESSHDGSGADDQLGKGVLSVNTGAGLVEGMRLDSNLLTTFAGSIVTAAGTGAGIGIANRDGTLHVHTATAGSITASASADDLVVENSASGGISILTPDNATGAVFFGSPSDSIGAVVSWRHDSNLLRLATANAGGIVLLKSGNQVDVLKIDGSQNTYIGDAGTTNYTQFAADGVQTMTGTAKVIKELWIDAGGIKSPGANPATATAHGDLETPAWKFANQAVQANEETVSFNLKIPPDMDRLVAPIVCLGWSTTAVVGVVEWQLEYLYSKAGEVTAVIAPATPDETLYVDDSASGTAEGLVSSQFIGINLPDADDICMHCKVKRLSSATANGGAESDTVADDVELHGVVLIYTSDKLGTAT